MTPELQQAFDDYQRAPTDQAAFVHLMNVARRLGAQDALAHLEQRKVQAENQARGQRQRVAVAETINDAVSNEAPDVDLELFWSFGRRAQAETPVHLTSVTDRMVWQKTRMIQLARAKQQALLQRVGVTPTGGTPSAAPAGQPRSMADQMKDLRRRQYSW